MSNRETVEREIEYTTEEIFHVLRGQPHLGYKWWCSMNSHNPEFYSSRTLYVVSLKKKIKQLKAYLSEVTSPTDLSPQVDYKPIQEAPPQEPLTSDPVLNQEMNVLLKKLLAAMQDHLTGLYQQGYQLKEGTFNDPT